MRRARGTTQRPTGPAPRIRNPLAIKRSPRVLERNVSVNTYVTPEWIPPDVELVRGDGKSCAIVGNAQSIMNRNDGHIIDVYDKVIRINNPKVTNNQCQGSRCDILFITPVSLKRLPRQKNRPYEIINVGTHLVNFFNEWSDKLRQDVGCDKARPTTGFIAIAYMIELGYNTSLFGFDWFRTPSLSAYHIAGKPDLQGDTKWEHHYPEWEEEIVKELITNAAMKTS